MSETAHDLWVFGYGSLMWRPGFPFQERRHARLVGYRRCFCIYSVHHRGTPDRPGMVLGLDRGGACQGIAYRVAAADVDAVVGYLSAREQINGVYRDVHAPVELLDGEKGEVLALTFVAERAHPNYAGPLALRAQARLIRGGRGVSGANVDYFVNTLRHLAELGIRERELERLATLVGGHVWRSAGGARPISALARSLVRSERLRPPLVRLRDRTLHSRFLYRLRLTR
jgi:cation transport protein ChaC